MTAFELIKSIALLTLASAVGLLLGIAEKKYRDDEEDE